MKILTIVHNKFILGLIVLSVVFAFVFLSNKKTYDCPNLANYSPEPVIVYYVMDYSFSHTNANYTRVKVIIWPNGRIIWSSIDDSGDSTIIKYYESTIPKKQVSDALTNIEILGTGKFDQYSLLAFDVPASFIYTKQANRKSIKMGLSLENTIPEFEDSERTKFRMAWNEIKTIIMKMIPEKGHEINPEFVYCE